MKRFFRTAAGLLCTLTVSALSSIGCANELLPFDASEAPVREEEDASPPPPPPDTKCQVVPDGAPLSLLATAPLGVSEAHLGRPVDARFELFAGESGKSIFPKGEVRTQGLHQIEHDIVTMDSKRAWDANVGAASKVWGVEVSGGSAKERRYASYRASQVVEVKELDDATEMTRPPAGAVWYLSRIYYGRSYELLFSGDSRTFTSSVKARLFIASGGARKFGEEHGLSVSARGRGLEPANGDAIFAQTADEIRASYVQSGEPVPVAVEYRSIPRGCVPVDEPFEWVEPSRVRLTLDKLDVYKSAKDGWTLDAKCLVGDREIVLDPKRLWEARTGIRSSCTDDVAGPRGDKDYCAFNLYYATTIELVDGDRLRCGVSGSMGTGPDALGVPYSEFSEIITAASVASPAGPRQFGDGDANAEYRVHYSLEYEAPAAPAPSKPTP